MELYTLVYVVLSFGLGYVWGHQNGKESVRRKEEMRRIMAKPRA